MIEEKGVVLIQSSSASSEMMADINSFGLYLLSTLLFLSGSNSSLALTNNAAENIPHAADPEQSKEERLELAIQTIMKTMEDGFARTAREVREIKEGVASLEEGIKSSKNEMQSSVKKEMTSINDGLKSLEEKLRALSSCKEGQTPTSGDLDPATRDIQSASEASLAAEKRLKAEIGQAVDTFTSSVTRASIAEQKVDNATVCPTEYGNCDDVKQRGLSTSGAYTVTISGKNVKVYCDMESDGGGWTVVQRRDDIEPRLDFNRDWADYKRGFGDLNGEFWLGLDTIHGLTSDPSTPMRLRVDLEDWEGEERVALYHTFRVQDEEKKYNLTVGGYEKGPGEDPGDSLAIHNGMAFATYDHDSDGSRRHCAASHKGGWWYNWCHDANLNGDSSLKGKHDQRSNGIIWYDWKRYHYSLRSTAMKIRPIR